jgi:hypothetical protein
MKSATLFAFASIFFAHIALAAEHPGNVFLVGEDVRVVVPATWAAGWRAVDIDGKEVARGAAGDTTPVLGKLPAGYFEVREQGGPGIVTAAVLAKTTSDENTPIAIDAAISWFYSDPEQIRDACELAKLAGVHWVRDRASWPELETARGTWAAETRYERAMRIEHEAGLKILQVNHLSPEWAAKKPSRFPEDLRDAYNFYRGLAKRWKGLADAIEPWNEPDIEMFGGHTGCEIASFQKAAYLGLKAGDPELPVNLSVFAIDRAETLDEFGANQVYPYFDRYDLHHYIRLPDYPRTYARHRAISGGRPMWTTEFNLTVNWADEKTKEPSDEELRIQAFRVGKVFAMALHEGTQKAFYFILGDYVEQNKQFGIVHRDLTPRPAYVAFAAVGRLLNAATPLGRVDFGDEKLKGYAFKTQVDGAEHETIVAWAETKATNVDVPGAEKVFDYLGREMRRGKSIKLTRETMFIVLPPGGSKSLKLEPPPAANGKLLPGAACPVVLQLSGHGDVKQSAFRVDKANELRLVAYNFSDKPARGKLSIGGAATPAGELAIPPGGRDERTLRVHAAGDIPVRLDLGEMGQAVVFARVTMTPTTKATTTTMPAQAAP